MALAAATYAFLPEIVIVTGTNDELKFNDITPAAQTATLTAGTYADIRALATEISTQMTASGAGTYVASVQFNGTQNRGFIRIQETSGPSNFDLLVDTHDTLEIWDILGYDTTTGSDLAGSSSYDGEFQHQYGWYSHTYPSFDSFDRIVVPSGQLFKTESAQTKRVSNPTDHYTRQIDFINIPAEKLRPLTSSDYMVNQDVQAWFSITGRGAEIQLYTSVDGWTLAGTYVLEAPMNNIDWNTANRTNIATEYYNIGFTFFKVS
jgi:hypothetical protein